jgi:hypothetical protein
MYLNYLLNKTLNVDPDGRADFDPRFLPVELQVSRSGRRVIDMMFLSCMCD